MNNFMRYISECRSTYSMHKLLLVFLLSILYVSANGQPARLLNPSFEGEPRDATIPRGWYACEKGTTPDILPGPWGVYLEAEAGETYVGLITRENGSWESIGQRLSKPLEKDECYYFTVSLAHSSAYMGYDKAIKLRIWGGKNKCTRTQLLGESERIESNEWETYSFDFTATEKMKYIIIEAHHSDDEFSHQGNILLDNISAIMKCGRTELIQLNKHTKG